MFLLGYMAGEQKIEVASYSNSTFADAWRGRSRALWGVGAVGLGFGLLVGAFAPFIPVIASLFISSIGSAATTSAAVALVPHSMAVFGALGMTTGFAVGGLVGASSGAASSVAKEMERRDRNHEQQMAKVMGVSLPVSVPEQSKEDTDRYFNPKVGGLFAVFGAIAGAVLAAGFFAPSMAVGGAVAATSSLAPALEIVLGGLASNTAAVTAYSVGVMASFGALFGVNFPKITTKAQDMAGELLSGKPLGTSWKRENEIAPDITEKNSVIEVKAQLENLPIASSVNHAGDCKGGFVDKCKERGSISSYQDFVVNSKENAADMKSGRVSV